MHLRSVDPSFSCPAIYEQPPQAESDVQHGPREDLLLKQGKLHDVFGERRVKARGRGSCIERATLSPAPKRKGAGVFVRMCALAVGSGRRQEGESLGPMSTSGMMTR